MYGQFMASILQVVLGTQLVAFFVLRLANEPTRSKKVELHEGGWFRLIMSVVAVAQVGVLVGVVVSPSSLSFAELELPSTLRWFGAGLGILALGGLAWTYRVLGDSYHSILHLQSNQRLITNGPYRRVRHPLYTGLFLTFFAFFLQSANGLVFVFGIGGLAVLLLHRVPKEEALLVSHFGRKYKEYMGQTNRFLP